MLTGGDLYPKTGQTFAFLYPPFAAVLLAPFSLFGRAFSIFCIDLVNVASWLVAAKLSERLAGGAGGKAWWVIALPSVISLPFIWDMYDLGQPNLMLLAMVLAGLVLLRDGREWGAGAMFALAAALKAFPVAILPLPDLAPALAGRGEHGGAAWSCSCSSSRRRCAASSATWPR